MDQQHLSSMIDAHEKYTGAFIDLVEEYNTLGEHICSLGDANQSYKDALTEVVAQFNAVGGHGIDKSAILNLSKQHEHFIMVCKHFRAFIDSNLKFQQFRDLAVALHTDATATPPAMGPDNAQLSDLDCDTRHGDETHNNMSDEHQRVVSEALADLDLNRLELDSRLPELD